MASYTTNLKTWGSTGQEFPDNYSYVEGEQPVDAWDNFFNANVVNDIEHLVGLTNARLADEDGGEAQSGGVRLGNAEWLTARNNAGDGDVNMWEVNASDEVESGAPIKLSAALLANSNDITNVGSVGASSVDTSTVDANDYHDPVSSSSVSGTVGLDLSSHNVFERTMTGDTTFTFDNPDGSTLGNSFTLVLSQDSTGGHAVTWPSSVEWNGGSAPSLDTAANAKHLISFISVDGGTTWEGVVTATNLA